MAKGTRDMNTSEHLFCERKLEMVEKGKKGAKFNKTQRGVERQFTNPKDLEKEQWVRM